MSGPTDTRATDEEIQICTFEVGGKLFGVDIMRIREIVRGLVVTPVPKAPFGMLGVIDLRGQVLPLFDLRQRFDVDSLEIDEAKERCLIVQVDGRVIGLRVDAVRDVLPLRRSELRLGTTVFAGEAADYFVGLAPVGKELALLLNLHRLLSDEDRIAIDLIQSTTPSFSEAKS